MCLALELPWKLPALTMHGQSLASSDQSTVGTTCKPKVNRVNKCWNRLPSVYRYGDALDDALIILTCQIKTSTSTLQGHTARFTSKLTSSSLVLVLLLLPTSSLFAPLLALIGHQISARHVTSRQRIALQNHPLSLAGHQQPVSGQQPPV